MKKFLIIMCLCCAVALDAMQAHAATARIVDSSQMDLRAINGVVAKSVVSIPVGTVIAWPVAGNPEDADKCLECNGQSISSTVYPELYAVVGGAVPDFRGLFLRGVGGNSASLGAVQGDAMQNLTGEFWLSGAFGSSSGAWPGSGSGSSGAFAHDGGYVSVNVGAHSFPM